MDAYKKVYFMLYKFLQENQKEILALTEQKSRELAGILVSSDQLKKGLPVFYAQLITVLQLEQSKLGTFANQNAMVEAARASDEPALAMASGHPSDVELAKSAGVHGCELMELGYTLSHVVHAYGHMCQSITEIAEVKKYSFTPNEFHDLNRCLDVAIAGAVTQYQSLRDHKDMHREVEHIGMLAHELRNCLTNISISIQMIKSGVVGIGGSTAQLLDDDLKRLNEIIERSLTEVRLRVDPEVHAVSINLLQVVDQILVSAQIETRLKKQLLDIKIDPSLTFKADLQLIHSALFNIVQNAIKFSRQGGKIELRGALHGEHIIIEVEDECGGLSGNTVELFRPFVQQNENKQGLGLGLTIARRAIELNNGTLEVSNLLGKGCIFKITLPSLL